MNYSTQICKASTMLTCDLLKIPFKRIINFRHDSGGIVGCKYCHEIDCVNHTLFSVYTENYENNELEIWETNSLLLLRVTSIPFFHSFQP